MSHQKRSRVGVMPRWQRHLSHWIFGLCALSGLGFFLKHELGYALAEIPARSLLVWHGVSAAFALLAVGAVIPGHIRSAWNARRNRGSGILMIAVMAMLMLSGLLLYYGDEAWHETALWLHWIVGFSAFAALPAHLILGQRANTRHQQLRAPITQTVATIPSLLQ